MSHKEGRADPNFRKALIITNLRNTKLYLYARNTAIIIHIQTYMSYLNYIATFCTTNDFNKNNVLLMTNLGKVRLNEV